MKYLTRKFSLYLITTLILLLGACEEVIEVELDNAEPQVVIEANISDNPENNLVKITMSADFYNPSEYENVSNAEIIVTAPNGDTFNFIEQTLGNYTNHELSAEVGSEYQISVKVDETTYFAKSTLSTPVIVDSLKIFAENRRFNDELRYEYHLYFQDNPGIRDFLRFKFYINNKRKSGVFRYEDRLTDGNYIEYNRFFFEDNKDINHGDIVKIEILTIDESTYEYFDTLGDALASSSKGGGPSGGTAPSNPTTNWSNDALGYFSANSLDSKSVVIK